MDDDLAHRRADNRLLRVARRAQGRNDVLLRPAAKAIADIASQVHRNPAADLVPAGEKYR